MQRWRVFGTLSPYPMRRSWTISTTHLQPAFAIRPGATISKNPRRGNPAALETALWKDPFARITMSLPKQPDRKVCMTCGGHADGIIYCSEQCRPSAALEWYSHASARADSPIMTEGFRIARSRFLTPSAASQATSDSSQFVPPPYRLEDPNPPTPKFVPVKEESLEEE